MKKTILIEKTILFTRVAILFDHELVNTLIESHYNPELQDKIIVGQVEKVVKNLKSAFIDYGEDKKGLLPLSQIPHCYEKNLHAGTKLPVQVTKVNQGSKGNKLTAKISLKGKYLVCLPFEPGINLSKKIKEPKARDSLKELLKDVFGEENYGVIVRTKALSADRQALIEDAKMLLEKTKKLMAIKDHLAKGNILHEERPIAMQAIVDEINHQDEIEVVCDDSTFYEEIKDLLENEYANYNNIKLIDFKPQDNLFFTYDIQKEWDELLHSKIWLKNGGNIVIDYTEAMTVIDVNSAKAVLSKNARKSVLELNLLAIRESVFQMMRRNLSGIIIVDLVEMPFKEDKEAVYEYAKNLICTLKETRTMVYPLTELGLMQFSRTKKHLGIHQKLLENCPLCHESYSVKNTMYHAFLIEKKVSLTHYQTTNQKIYIKCNDSLYEFLVDKGVKEALEKRYEVDIFLIKSKDLGEKSFLCQFYPF